MAPIAKIMNIVESMFSKGSYEDRTADLPHCFAINRNEIERIIYIYQYSNCHCMSIKVPLIQRSVTISVVRAHC